MMPCLNEAETWRAASQGRAFLTRSGIAAKCVVADNGSTDGSQQIAAGRARASCRSRAKGYGSALQGGIAAARGST